MFSLENMIPSYPVVFHGHVATLCWQFLIKELDTLEPPRGAFWMVLKPPHCIESKAKYKTSDGHTKSENRWRPAFAERALFQLLLRRGAPGSLPGKGSACVSGRVRLVQPAQASGHRPFVFWFPGSGGDSE